MSSSSASSGQEEDAMIPATSTLVIDDFANFNGHQWSDECTLLPSYKVSMLFEHKATASDSDWGSGRYCAIFLHNGYSGDLYRFIVRYQLSILGRNRQKLLTVAGKIIFSEYTQYKPMYIFSRNDLLNVENELLNKGKLTIYCEFYKVDSIADEAEPLPSNLRHDYAKLLEDGKQSDVTLVVDGSELRAHQLILTARSPVFAAMFEHDMKEKQQNQVEIEEMSADVCKQLLNYIYTDQVDQLDVHAVDLLAAADRYQLDRLKRLCEQYLIANPATETVAQVLVLADLHQMPALKAKCIEFICDNGEEVKATDGWKILATKLELMTEMFLHSIKYLKE